MCMRKTFRGLVKLNRWFKGAYGVNIENLQPVINFFFQTFRVYLNAHMVNATS